MKLNRNQLFSLPLVIFAIQFLSAQQPIPFNDKRWSIQARGHIIENYKGHPAIYLQNGQARLQDEKFLNGIIEFDIYLQDRVSFSGFFFRMVDSANYEDFYFRSHQAGRPDAYQYTPVFNDDPAWQLYHDQYDIVNDGFVSWKEQSKGIGYNSPLLFPLEKWMHVKLIVNDRQAELYLDRKEKPAAFIRKLVREPQAGAVGIASGGSAAWFANFTVTHQQQLELKTKEAAPEVKRAPGLITDWSISNPFKERTITNLTQLDNQLLTRSAWKTLKVDDNGVGNISRLTSLIDSNNTVFARLVIHSEKDEVKRFDFGYSDKARVYLNGKVLYSGTAVFRTRDYRYLGTIGLFDTLYLNLKKGENILIVAVTESFGGWGIIGRLQ